MAKFVKLFLGLAVVISALVAAHAESLPPVRRIVVFSPGVRPEQRVSIAQASGGVLVRELRLINAVVIRVPASRLTFTEAWLREREEIVRVDEDPYVNWLLGPAAATRDFRLPDPKTIIRDFRAAQGETGQEVPWGIKRVNAAAAWEKSRGQGVKVVVIDTGIDYNHPDLKANMRGGWNSITPGGDYMDDNGHGTHCAGTLAAVDDEAGVVGVAPNVELYGVKVLNSGGSGTFSDVIAGMLWAVENKMQVASMSLGASRGNQALKDAVDAMVKGGVALVAAAGNSGSSVGYPAAYLGAMAIAAMDSSDNVASFSSRGPEVALIAPGVAVRSSYMGGGYRVLSGTSMATPHVSGLAALVIKAKGVSGYEGVRAALQASAVPLSGVPAEQQGAGVVDAAKLVR